MMAGASEPAMTRRGAPARVSPTPRPSENAAARRWVESGQPWTVRAPVGRARLDGLDDLGQAVADAVRRRTHGVDGVRQARSRVSDGVAGVGRGAMPGGGGRGGHGSCSSCGRRRRLRREHAAGVVARSRDADPIGLAAGLRADGRLVPGLPVPAGPPIGVVHPSPAPSGGRGRVASATSGGRAATAGRRSPPSACSRRSWPRRRPRSGDRAGRRRNGTRRPVPAARAPGSPSAARGCRRARAPSAAGRTRLRVAALRAERRAPEQPAAHDGRLGLDLADRDRRGCGARPPASSTAAAAAGRPATGSRSRARASVSGESSIGSVTRREPGDDDPLIGSEAVHGARRDVERGTRPERATAPSEERELALQDEAPVLELAGLLDRRPGRAAVGQVGDDEDRLAQQRVAGDESPGPNGLELTRRNPQSGPSRSRSCWSLASPTGPPYRMHCGASTGRCAGSARAESGPGARTSSSRQRGRLNPNSDPPPVARPRPDPPAHRGDQAATDVQADPGTGGAARRLR